MKLFNIRYPNTLFEVLSTCQSPVYLTAQDGSLVEPEEYRRHVNPHKVLEEVEVTATCLADVQRLIHFSLEAAMERSKRSA